MKIKPTFHKGKVKKMSNKQYKRTNYNGIWRSEHIGQEVVVTGFVQKQRNLGNLIFIDLRDRTGLLQLAFDDNTKEEVKKIASKVRTEFVLLAKGVIRERISKNLEIPTGEIELYVDHLEILSEAETTPFEITDTTEVKEELRLQYRYLDLRRTQMQEAIMMRHRISKITRDYFDEKGFLEIETPTMVKSTPEGARDYVVPSRVHPGEFYALPQSPQLFKQLLMVSGFDKYFQIARCYRDEDLRADRQPEFTQIDLEMSYIDEEDIMEVNEGFMAYLYKRLFDITLPTPFKRMTYKEAMERYGSDKPDTRFGLELVNLSEGLKNTEFKVFAGAIEGGGSVRAINAKGLADNMSRKEIDKLTDTVKLFKGKGLAFTKWGSENTSSSFEKFLKEEEIAYIYKALNAQKGDLLLVVADTRDTVVFDSLGALRLQLAKKFEMYDPKEIDFLWVTDFPMFERNEEGRISAVHHPFTSPKVEDMHLMDTEPEKMRARAYDMVLNGVELGGGSIRITNRDLQNKVFETLGFTKEEAQAQFGFLLDAFKYGVPPHGGMAYGFDRVVMQCLNKTSIRDVMAFPKVQSARDLMVDCPSPVSDEQLKELSLKVTKEEEK